MISIIIPVYNVSSYLTTCLESIVRQSIEDFEVILIDDGSTDSSKKICKNFCDKDDRFTYYYQQNSGVSTARNFGISVSKGKWLAFIDPDDFVEEDYLKSLLPEDNEDITKLIGGGFILKADSIEKEFRILNPRKVSANEAISLMIKDPNFYSYVWNKLFLREIIIKNNIIFDSDMYYGEDLLFIFHYLKIIEKVKLIPMTGYYYCRNKNSIGGVLTEDKLERKLTYIDVLSYVETNIDDTDQELKKELNNRISLVGVIDRANLIKFKYSQERIRNFSKKIAPYLKATFFKYGSMKEKLKITLVYLFPVRSLRFMKAKDKKNDISLFS